MYQAESNVYHQWLACLIAGEWHLHISDPSGNPSPIGVYTSLEQAKEHAEHFELWEHEIRSFTKRNGGISDFPKVP